MSTSLGTVVTMVLVTTIITPIINLHMFQTTILVPYPNVSDIRGKHMPLSNENFEANKILMEQVASHNTMIQEFNNSVASISSDIKNLQLQPIWLDKALLKLADNQATLLSMSAGKPQEQPVVDMNSINIA